MARRSQVVVRLPFLYLTDQDGIEFDLYSCHWAGSDDLGTQTVWVSPSLSGEAFGYSAGKCENHPENDTIIIRGGL